MRFDAIAKLVPAMSYSSHCQDGNNVVSRVQVIVASFPRQDASEEIRLISKQDERLIVRKAVSSGQTTLEPGTGVP